MGAILQGLLSVALVIGVGYLAARLRIVPSGAVETLSRLVFFVAMPALLLRTVGSSTLSQLLSAELGVTALATTVGICCYLVVARLLWHRRWGQATIGALAASYVNAGNLGIAIAAQVLGDAHYVIPVMMYQLVVLAPLSFVVLDAAASGHRPGLGRIARSTLANPMVLGIAGGVVLAASSWQMPVVLDGPVELIAGLAIPGALLAFGMSFHAAPVPGRNGNTGELALIVMLKFLVVPAAAYLVAVTVFDLQGMALLAGVLCAGLPSAQNVFLYALRYRVGVALARDAVAVTTVLCAPVLVVIVALLHP